MLFFEADFFFKQKISHPTKMTFRTNFKLPDDSYDWWTIFSWKSKLDFADPMFQPFFCEIVMDIILHSIHFHLWQPFFHDWACMMRMSPLVIIMKKFVKTLQLLNFRFDTIFDIHILSFFSGDEIKPVMTSLSTTNKMMAFSSTITGFKVKSFKVSTEMSSQIRESNETERLLSCVFFDPFCLQFFLTSDTKYDIHYKKILLSLIVESLKNICNIFFELLCYNNFFELLVRTVFQLFFSCQNDVIFI